MEKRTWLSIAMAMFLSASQGFAQENTGAAPQSAAITDSAGVYVTRAEAGKPAIYEIRFTPVDTLATDAAFVLTFPEAFDLSLLDIVGSTSIDGGLKIAKDKQQVTVSRTGLGSPVDPGKKIGIKLGMIKNPQNLTATYSVKLQIRPSARRQKTQINQARIHFTGQ